MKNQAKRLTAVFLAFSMIVNAPGQSVWAADMTEPTSGVRKETEIRSDESPAQEDRETIAAAQEAQTVVEAYSLSERTPVLTEEASAAAEEEILSESEDVSEPEAAVDDKESPELVVEEVAPVSEGLSGSSMETPAAASDDALIADSLDYFICSRHEDENGEAYISIDELIEENAGITSAVIPAEGSYEGEILPVRCIAHDAFFRAWEMTSVTIPASVRKIGSNAFARLSNLKDVIFEPNSELQTIGEFAFEQSGITSMTIPKSVSSMGQGVFRWCYDLETVVFEEGSRMRPLPEQTFLCGEDDYHSGETKLASVTLPEGLEEIGDYAFCKTGLPSIVIPASVRSIGTGAFYSCKSLSTVELQEGSCLENIANIAFAESALTSIALPASVTAIGEMAFSDTPDLEEVTFGDGAQLTTIRNATFQGSGLVRLELPPSVETIEPFAFFQCDNLQEIVFPEDSALTTIGKQAFQQAGMETVTIPKSVSEIGESAFRSGPNLKTVNFEEGSALRNLGRYVFSFPVEDGVTSQLETVNLAEGLETIGQQAFAGIASRSIRIPASVRELGDAAFYGCENLEIVEFSEDSQLETIDNSAFGMCGLKNITFPASLKKIGQSICLNCQSLSQVRFAEDAPNLKELGAYSFQNTALTEFEFMTVSNVTIEGIFVDDGVKVLCSYGAPFLERLQNLGIAYECVGDSLQVDVKDENGNLLTSGYTVKWYREGQEDSVGRGSRIDLSAGDRAEEFSFEIELDEEMGKRYYTPKRVTMADNKRVATVSLRPISTLSLSGKIVDAAGKPIGGASVRVTAEYDNESVEDVEDKLTTKKDGTFSVELPFVAISVEVSCDGYYNRKVLVTLGQGESETLELEPITLYALPASKVHLSVASVASVREGKILTDPEKTQAYSLENYSFSLYDKNENLLSGVVREGFDLYLGEDASKYAEQELTLRSVYQDGSMTADDVVVRLDGQSVGEAEVIFRENGRILLEEPEGEIPAYVYVFDQDGKQVENGLISSSWQSGPLTDGSYQVVLLQEQGYIKELTDLELLNELGLEDGTDYAIAPAEVKKGVITQLTGLTVPVFDTARFDYVEKENTYVKLNRSPVAQGNLVSLRVGFELKPEYANQLGSRKVVLPLPAGVEYVPGSATINGSSVSDVSYGNQKRLTVSTDETSAVFRCMLMTQESGDFTLAPYLSFERALSGMTAKGMQPLGEVALPVQKQYVNVPEQTGKQTICVSGTVLPDSAVKIYDGEVCVGKTKAKTSGSWMCRVTLNKPYLHSEHFIYAKVDTDYGTYSTEKKRVIYDTRFADVKKVVMTNFGHQEVTTEWNFQSDTAVVGSYDYNPNYPTITFQVYFDTDAPDALGELLPEVYVKSIGGNGAITWILARYDAATGTWIGSKDLDYDTAPVKLTVAFDQPEISDLLDFEEMADNCKSYEELLAKLNVSMEDFYDMEVTEDTEDALRITYIPKRENLNLPKLYYSMEIISASEAQGYGYTTMYDTEGNPSTVYADVENSDNQLLMVTMLNDGSALKTSLRGEEGPATASYISDVGGSIGESLWKGALSALTFGLSDQYFLIDEVNKMYGVVEANKDAFVQAEDNIYRNLLPHKQRNGNPALYRDEIVAFAQQTANLQDKYYQMSEGLRREIQTYNQMMALYNGIGAIPGLKAAKGANIAWKVWYKAISKDMVMDRWVKWEMGKSIGENMLPNVAELMSGYYKNYLDARIANLHNAMLGELHDLEARIIASYHEDPEPEEPNPEMEQPSPDSHVMKPDPSGYVYEAVPSNRLEGVTASIYQKIQETDASGEEIGEPTWKLWDAGSYDEIQNQVTGADGAYGWDVPFGTWKIKYEKKDYKPAESAEMEVPPEWTDVNIGMVSTDAPEVKYLNVYEERIEIVLTQYVLPKTMESGIVVTVDGTMLSGTIEPLDLEESYDKKASYASKYQFVPDAPLALNTAVTVELSGVKSYNEQTIAQYSENLPVKKEIREILATDVPVVAYQEEGILTFSLTDAGAGKAVQITSLMPSILEPSDADKDGAVTVTADATGMLTVPVKGLMPGTGVLRLEMPEYGLELEQKITVCRHSWQNVVTEPTCTEQGFTTHTCTSCGEIYTDSYTAARGHSWDAGKPDGTGKRVYHCTVCNEMRTEELTDIASCTTTLAGGCVYTGKEQKPAVTVSEGGKTLVEGQDYTVSYSDNVNAGTAKVVVTGTGNYRGTVTKTFTIAKAVNSMTVSDITRTYKKKKQSVSVVPGQAGGARLSYKSGNRKVKLTASGKATIPAKFIGKAIITVTASETDNFLKTEKKITITVNPLGTKLSRVNNVSGKKAEVRWKKTADVTGYQIQYATDKNFRKGAKIVTVKGKSKTSGTIKKLETKKTYYIRVRTYKTVSGVKYYSAWSRAKKVKIKK